MKFNEEGSNDAYREFNYNSMTFYGFIVNGDIELDGLSII